MYGFTREATIIGMTLTPIYDALVASMPQPVMPAAPERKPMSKRARHRLTRHQNTIMAAAVAPTQP